MTYNFNQGYKVPCDALWCEAVEKKGENINDVIINELEMDGFDDTHRLGKEMKIAFRREDDLVVLWGYAKTMWAAKMIVDYVAYHCGEDPSFLYDRIIHKV